MLRKLVYLVLVLFIGVAVLAWRQPDQFTVERSVLVQASPARIYPLVSDLKAFNTWNPFLAQDPDTQLRYEAVTAGAGAAYAWEGGKSGAGSMRILEATPPEKVVVKLDFTKPMEGHNTVVFALRPEGESTRVSWTMSGPMGFVNKLFGLVFNMDTMVGGEFEKGLASLKALAEKP